MFVLYDIVAGEAPLKLSRGYMLMSQFQCGMLHVYEQLRYMQSFQGEEII